MNELPAGFVPGSLHRHPRRLWGLPLVTRSSGKDPRTGRGHVSRGVLAIGQRAIGVVSVGQLSIGVVALGQLALGVVAGLGQGCLGLVAVGQLTGTVLAGLGQLVLGQLALGQLAAAREAIAQQALTLPSAGVYLASAAVLALSGTVLILAQRRRLTAWKPLLGEPGKHQAKDGDGQEHWLVEGKAVLDEPLVAPFGDHRCVWYRLRLRDPRDGSIISEETAGDDFFVEGQDGTTVRVATARAQVWAEAEWVPEPLGSAWRDRVPPGRLPEEAFPHLAQEWIPLGAPVRVAGAAAQEPDPKGEAKLYRHTGTRLVLASTARTPLLATTLPRNELNADLRLAPRVGWLQVAVAAVALVLGAAAAAW